MDKPIQILELEKEYNISITERASGINYHKNSYKVDSKNEIVELNLSENKISDVSFLHNFNSLIVLSLNNNLILDISPLESLILLEDLNLSNNQISDILVLGNLVQLRSLGLSNNKIVNILELENLKLLSYLAISDNQITDISVLLELPLLTTLNLSYNKISNISLLGNLVQLTSLNAWNCNISDISFLKELGLLTNLSLWNNKVTDISILEKLKLLEILDLGYNEITDISGLENLNLLRYLDLSSNKIVDISNLKELTLLVRINLSFNKISDILILENLTSLKYLFLGSNEIFDISILGYLNSLLTLDLNNNNISNISVLENLGLLRDLNLSYNPILEISSIRNYGNIKRISLSKIKGRDFSSLSGLISLNELVISNNEISDISFLESLIELEILNLNNNKISKLKFVSKIKDVKKIFLSQNEIFDLNQLNFLLEKPLYIEANNNPCFNGYEIKFENNKNHYDLILNLLKKIDEETREYVLPTKVLLLGNTGCGKSTLLNYILQDKKPRVFENNLTSTHIIQVETFPKKSKRNDIPTAVFYDFGGQDYYHGLYKAFLSNDSLNILLWNSKNDKNQIRKDRNGQFTRDYDRNYWLYQLKFQYGNSKKEKINEKSEPILLVQTHADDNFYNRETYNNNSNNFNIINEFHLAFNSDAVEMNKTLSINLHYFEETLKEQIKLKQIIKNEPTWYRLFLNFILKSKRKSYVKLSDLVPHYKRESDKNNYLLPEVLREIAQTGLILYYKDDDDLKDIVWLNPTGIIENVHKKILSQKIIKENKGIIDQKIFDKLVKDDKIIKLLINQRVIFLDEFENNYIIPGYLPLTEEEDKLYELLTFDFIEPNFVLKFEYFIPFGLINQLVCFYGKDKNKKHYWRDQLLFTKDNCKILIKLDFTNLEISVSIKSKGDNRKLDKLQKEIFKDIVNIYWDKVPEIKHKDIKESNIKIEDISIENLIEGNLKASISHEDIIDENLIDIKTKVSLYLEDFNYPLVSPDDLYISIDNKYFVNHKELQDENKIFNKIKSFGLEIKKETQNDKEIEIRKINKNLVSEKNVGLFRNFTGNKNTENMKKIFISYSKFDDDYRKEFVKHLVTLRDEGLIEDFNCEEIDLGDNSHNVIQKELSECDYMIALVSIDFLNTEYIRKFEVEKAKVLGKKIIPIIIKPCDWENSIVKDFHASLRGTNISLDKDLFLKDKFKETSEIERHAWWTKVIKELRLKIFNK